MSPAAAGHSRTSPRAEHAVVLGASLAGLLTARVLADHFERVTVVERDRLPTGYEDRPGVPQFQHLHITLASGVQIIEQLLPGITADLSDDGACISDLGWSRRFYQGNYLYRAATELRGLGATRQLLEGHVRRRVLARPNLTVLDGCRAQGLLAAQPLGRICGARVVRRGEGAADESVFADLVVDTTGRGSRAPAWLQELGYPPPIEDVVPVAVGYATRFYRRSPSDLAGDPLLVVFPDPPNPRMGAAMAVEGNRWMVILAGMLGDHPPTDDDGFRAFAAGLETRDLYQFVNTLEPLGHAVRTRFPAQRRRRYERLTQAPEGFVVIGDAACSFNPLYGQGISVAAMQAVLLGDSLRASGMKDLARRYFSGAAKIVDVPWSIAVGSDLRFSEVEGPRGARVRLVNRYMARLLKAAAHDPLVARRFSEVVHLVAAPTTLFHPRILRRVFAGEGRGRRLGGLSRGDQPGATSPSSG